MKTFSANTAIKPLELKSMRYCYDDAQEGPMSFCCTSPQALWEVSPPSQRSQFFYGAVSPPAGHLASVQVVFTDVPLPGKCSTLIGLTDMSAHAFCIIAGCKDNIKKM